MPKMPSQAAYISIYSTYHCQKKKKSEVFCCLMIFNDHWHFFLSAGLKACETDAYGSVRHSTWAKAHLNQGFPQQLPVTPQLSLPFSSCCAHDSTWKLPVQQAIGKNGCGWINKSCLWLRQSQAQHKFRWTFPSHATDLRACQLIHRSHSRASVPSSHIIAAKLKGLCSTQLSKHAQDCWTTQFSSKPVILQVLHHKNFYLHNDTDFPKNQHPRNKIPSIMTCWDMRTACNLSQTAG